MPVNLVQLLHGYDQSQWYCMNDKFEKYSKIMVTKSYHATIISELHQKIGTLRVTTAKQLFRTSETHAEC